MINKKKEGGHVSPSFFCFNSSQIMLCSTCDDDDDDDVQSQTIINVHPTFSCIGAAIVRRRTSTYFRSCCTRNIMTYWNDISKNFMIKKTLRMINTEYRNTVIQFLLSIAIRIWRAPCSWTSENRSSIFYVVQLINHLTAGWTNVCLKRKIDDLNFEW